IIFLILDVGFYFIFHFHYYNLRFLTKIFIIFLLNFFAFIGVFISFKKSIEYPIEDSFKYEIENWLVTKAKFRVDWFNSSIVLDSINYINSTGKPNLFNSIINYYPSISSDGIHFK